MDVVCVDKTGTLTMNRLTVADVAAAPGFKPDDVVRYGVLASSEAGGDAIDSAFITDAKGRGINTAELIQVEFIPFDASTRRTEALVKEGDGTIHVMKGAATVIMDITCQAATPESWAGRAIADFTARGYRILAVAKGPGKEKMGLVGLAALRDQLRPDSRSFVKDLNELGISTKILTGDSFAIARQVSTELGLGGNIVRMPDIKAGDGSGESPELVDKGTGFAEIYPEDKFRIVKALQAKGHVVGMTGDGVNDAPALRQAEVGIAVSNATDVAKKASSVVLTREGLGGIDDLVKVGRQIYHRITTWILNKMVRTFKRVVFIISAFILTGLYVVSTLDMIILLFLSDYVTLALSTDNVRYSRKPESWDIRGMVKSGAILGIIMVFESLAILYAGLYWFEMQADTGRLHTFVLAFLVYSGYFTLLALRERRHFWESRPSAPLAVLMIFNSVLIFILSITGTVGISPISTWEVVFVIIYCFVITLLLNDFIKVGLARRFRVVF
jgi:H+-transporting ATPase